MNKLSCNTARDLLPLYVDGVLSPETVREVQRHLETCEACREERRRMTGILTLPDNESLHRESARPLRRLKKKAAIVLAALLVLISALTAGAVRLLSGNDGPVSPLFPADLIWQDGLIAQSLAPGEEVRSGSEITLEEGQTVYCVMNWSRAGLELQMGLKREDGAEYASEAKAGGHDEAAFRDLPAGKYRLFIRHTGEYAGLPAYEDPDGFPEVSFDAFCVMNYAIG